MKVLKRIFSQWHRYIMALILLGIFWAWIYTGFVGDTSAKKKVTIFINANAVHARKLSLKLDEDLPEGIKMVQVYDFGYSAFPANDDGDIYIVKQSVLERTLDEHPESVAPIADPAGHETYTRGGTVYGLLLFDAATQTGPGMQDYILYRLPTSPEPENYYLCFGTESLHFAGNENAVDNAAWQVAEGIFRLDD